MRNVFISYSHKDECWKDDLLTHLNVFETLKLIKVWHDRNTEGGQNWSPPIESAIDQADIAVLLISGDYLDSDYINTHEVPRILARRASKALHVLPVILRPCLWKRLPWLSGILALPKDGRPLSAGSRHAIESQLVDIAEKVADIPEFPPTQLRTPTRTFSKLPKRYVKLPIVSRQLFGRDTQLALLDAAWKSPKTRILALHGSGGTGKTALVMNWLSRMKRQRYSGAECVFGWPFHAQGASEDAQRPADEFITKALDWFGDPDPKRGYGWEKGIRLATLVGKHRTLLILDGLEALQYQQGELGGRLRDPAVETLLGELARQDRGLCLITTRRAIGDLSNVAGNTASVGLNNVLLEHLSEDAAIKYLRRLGVAASLLDLTAIWRDLHGNALALTLLGGYFAVAGRGQIQAYLAMSKETKDKLNPTERVLAWCDSWLVDTPEGNILSIISLFESPVESSELKTVAESPVIAGINDKVYDLGQDGWNNAVKRLRRSRLISPGHSRDQNLDCHPGVRRYFADGLIKHNLESWQAAHRRLYDYYKNLPNSEQPETLDEVAPLLSAVSHGCQAGIHQQAFEEVYQPRINRWNKFYLTDQLGAFGAALTALSRFFTEPWSGIVAELMPDDKAGILNEAGYCLRAVGRLHDAVTPMAAGLDAWIERQNWKEAAISANNLSELYLLRGDIHQALVMARQSVGFAYRSRNSLQRGGSRTTLADAYHQQGKFEKAERLFQQAQTLEFSRPGEVPWLCSLQGFQYCDLLLSLDREPELRERMNLLSRVQQSDLLSRALAESQIGLILLRFYGSDLELDNAAKHLTLAVSLFRQCGHVEHLCRGLIGRAEFYLKTRQIDAAQRDLGEALLIAKSGGMLLNEVDCQIQYAWLHHNLGRNREQARGCMLRAKDLIRQTGYHRHDNQLSLLEERIESYRKQKSRPK